MDNARLNFEKNYALRANFFILIRNIRIKAIYITVFLTINISCWIRSLYIYFYPLPDIEKTISRASQYKTGANGMTVLHQS